MAIDLGNDPVGTPPDLTQQEQIRTALGAIADAPSDGEKYVQLDGEWVLLTPPPPPPNRAYDSGNNVLFEEASDAIPTRWTQSNSAAVASVDFTPTLTSIGSYAFAYCSSLTSITIPNDVLTIGNFAFVDSGLTSVTIGNSVETIGSAAFRATNITSLTIPDSVTSLNNAVQAYWGSFHSCSSLTSVSIGAGLTSLGVYTFANCSALQSINIPNNITAIDWGTFQYSGLTSITIPANVSSIGWYAFLGCSSLSTVNILAMTAPSLGSYAFAYCYSLGAIHVPIGSTGYGYTYGGITVVQDL